MSEYGRDLISHDKERCEQESFDWLQAELIWAFAASELSYVPLTAAEIIKRNQND